MNRDNLGDRIKMYEKLNSQILMPKVPVILRLDGKSFHNLTRNYDKPWDMGFVEAIQKTTLYLCERIQGCQFGYCQSDEISILLQDNNKYSTTLFFNGKVQKICSVAASMASVVFNKYLNRDTEAVFDCRAFNIPEHEVVNSFLWRQQDCSINSIQMLSRANFTHKECHKKNTSQLQDMLMTKQINWNDTPTHLKRGTAVKRSNPVESIVDGKTVEVRNWEIDEEMPILSQDRDYIPIQGLWSGEKTN